MRSNLSLLLLLGLLPAVGCNLGPGSGSGGDDDDATGDDDDATGNDPQVVTIAQIHAGEVEPETFITIENVVVTTPMRYDEDDNEGDFWIAHPDGGPASGLYVFSFYDVVDALDEADAAQPGDVINITGTYKDPFSGTLLEIQLTNADNVEVVGSTSLPEPYLVDADDISGGFAPADLIGAIVAVEDVVVDQAPSYDTFNEWTGDGVIVVDDFYYADVELGYAVDRVSGVLHSNFGDASIFPRWDTDVEYTYPGCDSGWDDDSLQGVRCRSLDEETEVTLEGLVVTSPAPYFGDAFFAQDLDATGNFSGILVYSVFDELEAPEIGTVIDVTGEAEWFRGLAQLVVFDTEEDYTETGDPNRAGDIVPLEITDPCDIGEEHEGMLVSVPTATVEEYDFFYPFAGCETIGIGSMFWDDLDSFQDETGGAGTVTNLVGVVSSRFDERTINPRSTDDWDTWGNATSAW